MGVVHRDIKPENWLYAAPGHRNLKAIDFGGWGWRGRGWGEVGGHAKRRWLVNPVPA
jgi:hypothetical protein